MSFVICVSYQFHRFSKYRFVTRNVGFLKKLSEHKNESFFYIENLSVGLLVLYVIHTSQLLTITLHSNSVFKLQRLVFPQTFREDQFSFFFFLVDSVSVEKLFRFKSRFTSWRIVVINPFDITSDYVVQKCFISGKLEEKCLNADQCSVL